MASRLRWASRRNRRDAARSPESAAAAMPAVYGNAEGRLRFVLVWQADRRQASTCRSRKEHPLMRAFTLDSFERPPGLREDLPSPQAGPGQLLVRVQASSVNPVDAGIAAGHLQAMFPYEFPVVLGRDYAGVIEQVGPAVTGYAPGDEVYGWLLHANPTVHDGSWAELIAVPQSGSVAHRPATL